MSTEEGARATAPTTLGSETERATRHLWVTAAVMVPLIVIGIQTVGFLLLGAAAVLVGPGWQTRASGAVLVALGGCGVVAMKDWSSGRPESRRIALALLPASALLLLWDAWRFGDTMRSQLWAFMPLVVAWLLLFLPAVRRFFSRS